MSSGGQTGADDGYVCGHSAHELDRLDLQGALYRHVTRRALEDAGLEPGFRILDAGCGTGDVTLLAAELAGAKGEVVGVDRDRDTIIAARARAEARGLSSVRFEAGDFEAATGSVPFDALIGRFVLMHQPDPARALSRAARAVRAGGLVVFVESHMAALLRASHSLPWSSLYDRVVHWKYHVVRAAGADTEAGLRLRRTFVRAGLPEPATRLEAPVEGGPDSPIYRYMAESVRSMLPMAERFGIGGFSRDEVDGLESDLRNELVASGGVLVCWPVVAAWTRIP